MAEQCWRCTRAGRHPGIVQKMAGPLTVVFCDEHWTEDPYRIAVADKPPAEPPGPNCHRS